MKEDDGWETNHSDIDADQAFKYIGYWAGMLSRDTVVILHNPITNEIVIADTVIPVKHRWPT